MQRFLLQTLKRSNTISIYLCHDRSRDWVVIKYTMCFVKDRYYAEFIVIALSLNIFYAKETAWT